MSELSSNYFCNRKCFSSFLSLVVVTLLLIVVFSLSKVFVESP